MTNREQRRYQCRGCGREREPSERFSARGKCPDCGDGRMVENYRQLIAHDGPAFDHWRRRCIAAFGGVALEDYEQLAAEPTAGD